MRSGLIVRLVDREFPSSSFTIRRLRLDHRQSGQNSQMEGFCLNSPQSTRNPKNRPSGDWKRDSALLA